ncbi:MAG: isoleucine--tRNA ligase, partial [Clostridia bacterium]|nr:isoleucine--tRNA ligase [Clostridia bacterium]
EGYYTAKDKGYTVVLDIQLTDALIREGFIREIISKVQTMRKDSGFEVMDHIEIYISGNDKLIALLQEDFAEVAGNTLADKLNINETAPEFSKDWDINGEKVTLGVKKI